MKSGGLDGGSAKNWTRWGSKPFSIWRIQISGLSVNILMSCSKERCVNCAANPVCNWKSLHRSEERRVGNESGSWLTGTDEVMKKEATTMTGVAPREAR